MARYVVNTKGSVRELIVEEVIVREDTEDYSPDLDVSRVNENYVSIAKAIVPLDVTYPRYVRRLLLEGKLTGIKVRIKGGVKWLIDRDSITAYIESKKRSTGLRNYILRISTENEVAVRKALLELDIEYELELAYKG
ncbi:MAG: hypothetical protein GF414_00715 [Candidatus Altiarchaeales archaeon]|nr:hypothetical protein [Candidatus Altiarchaeales archaeon]